MTATPGTDAVRLERDGDVAVIHLDDGKANALSHAAIDGLVAALHTARTESRAVAVIGRPGRFSAGFDLTTMRAGVAQARALLGAGGRLGVDLFTSPVPVVLGCTGHALAMGAILLLCADVRVGAAGAFKLGFNEVAIGMPMPHFAIELARHRLVPTEVERSIQQATIYDPDGAQVAGFLDEVVAVDDVATVAVERAKALAAYVDAAAFRVTRDHVRGEAADRLRRALDDDERTAGPPP